MATAQGKSPCYQVWCAWAYIVEMMLLVAEGQDLIRHYCLSQKHIACHISNSDPGHMHSG